MLKGLAGASTVAKQQERAAGDAACCGVLVAGHRVECGVAVTASQGRDGLWMEYEGLLVGGRHEESFALAALNGMRD